MGCRKEQNPGYGWDGCENSNGRVNEKKAEWNKDS